MDDPWQTATFGRREWLALPEFSIACIEAWIEPGAAVSQLHAVDLQPMELGGKPGLEFRVYPLRGDRRTFVGAAALLAAGGGERVVRTLVTVGTATWPIDLELVPEEPAGLPMLLGTGLTGFAVDQERSFLAGPPALVFGSPAGGGLRAGAPGTLVR